MAGMQMWAYVFLLVGGVVHLVPSVGSWLTGLTGGTSYVQMVVGLVSVVLALMGLFKK